MIAATRESIDRQCSMVGGTSGVALGTNGTGSGRGFGDVVEIGTDCVGVTIITLSVRTLMFASRSSSTVESTCTQRWMRPVISFSNFIKAFLDTLIREFYLSKLKKRIKKPGDLTDVLPTTNTLNEALHEMACILYFGHCHSLSFKVFRRHQPTRFSTRSREINAVVAACEYFFENKWNML